MQEQGVEGHLSPGASTCRCPVRENSWRPSRTGGYKPRMNGWRRMGVLVSVVPAALLSACTPPKQGDDARPSISPSRSSSAAQSATTTPDDRCDKRQRTAVRALEYPFILAGDRVLSSSATGGSSFASIKTDSRVLPVEPVRRWSGEARPTTAGRSQLTAEGLSSSRSVTRCTCTCVATDDCTTSRSRWSAAATTDFRAGAPSRSRGFTDLGARDARSGPVRGRPSVWVARKLPERMPPRCVDLRDTTSVLRLRSRNRAGDEDRWTTARWW